MRKVLNGEVFFILFLLSGFYKNKFMEVFVLDPTALFFVLSLTTAVFRLYKRGSLGKESITPLIIYLSILLVIVASLFFAGTNLYAYDKVIKFATITAWSFAGVFFLTNYNNPIKSLKRYLYTFLGVGIAMTLDIFIVGDIDDSGFFTALGSSYILLGRMVGMVALIVLSYLILKKHSKNKNLVLMSLSVIFVYVLLLSGGRMPVISFLVCLFLLMILGIKITSFSLADIKFKKKTLYLSMLIVVSTPIALFYIGKSDLTFVNRFTSLFSNSGTAEISRMTHYERAWNMFLDTGLLGSGIGNYRSQLVAEISYPHNVFLEFAAELGIIGVFLFLALVFIALKRYFNNFDRGNFYSVIILLLFVFNFMAANVAGDINDNRIMFFTIGLLMQSKVFRSGAKATVTESPKSELKK